MALAATFAGMGFGNAGVHIPHANGYPIAGRVRDFHPKDYPGRARDGAARHVGGADRAGGLPVHLRRGPERHLRAASLLDPSRRPVDGGTADTLPAVIIDLMRDIDIPNGIGAVGYGEDDVDDLVEGTLKQQRLLADLPQGRHRRGPRRRSSGRRSSSGESEVFG